MALVRASPRGLRLLILGVLAGLAVPACAGSPREPAPVPAEERTVPPHLTYVSNPTEIRAEKVALILPADLGEDLRVEGLSAGWEERRGRRVWTGGGDCRLVLEELEIRARSLTVTLVPDQAEPEVLLTAEGHVVLAHVSRRIGNLSEDLEFLMIRNEKRLER